MGYGLEINYLALALAILDDNCPEPGAAFWRLAKEKPKHSRSMTAQRMLDEDNVLIMAEMKTSGKSYREIGKAYGVSDNTVYR